MAKVQWQQRIMQFTLCYFLCRYLHIQSGALLQLNNLEDPKLRRLVKALTATALRRRVDSTIKKYVSALEDPGRCKRKNAKFPSTGASSGAVLAATQ